MSDILELPALQHGIPMTQQAITEAVNRNPGVVREELYYLVIRGQLHRACGVGTAPAFYHLARSPQ